MFAAPHVALAICMPGHWLSGCREVEGRAARGVFVVTHASVFWAERVADVSKLPAPDKSCAFRKVPRPANHPRRLLVPARSKCNQFTVAYMFARVSVRGIGARRQQV